MFLHVCVILSTGGGLCIPEYTWAGGSVSQLAPEQRGMCRQVYVDRGCVWTWGCAQGFVWAGGVDIGVCVDRDRGVDRGYTPPQPLTRDGH